jgi:hypothetical protein
MTHHCKTTRKIAVALAATLMLAVSALAQDSETVLHAFTGRSDGALGGFQLVADSAGNLYGTTLDGGNTNAECGVYFGTAGCGVVFKLSPAANGSWKETVLHTFTGGKDGGLPVGGVVLDSAGNLYGSAFFGGDKEPNCSYGGDSVGCGVVYKLSPTAKGPWKETVLYSFTGGSDGSFPFAGVTLDSGGNVYGAAGAGGLLSCNTGGTGCGIVFKLTSNGQGPWTETVLYAFTGGADGNLPFASVTFDTSGNLYGTTRIGGDASVSCLGYTGCGVIFELTPTSSGPWTETVLHAFTGGADGALPLLGVTLDPDGNVYGTTPFGGDTTQTICAMQEFPGCGVVFELTKVSETWEETVIHTFTGPSDGAEPIAPLIFDSAGNLYGGADLGGGYTYGLVFKLTPAGGSWTKSDLYDFHGGATGSYPQSNLLFDSAGNLYGMAESSGDMAGCGGYGCGLVFKLHPEDGSLAGPR